MLLLLFAWAEGRRKQGANVILCISTIGWINWNFICWYVYLEFYTEVDGINTQNSLDIFGWKLHIKSSLQTDLCYVR